MPAFSGIHIHGYDRTGVKVVALTASAFVGRRRIAGTEVIQVQLGIVTLPEPRHSPRRDASAVEIGPSLRARISHLQHGSLHHIHWPLSGFGIEGLQKAPGASRSFPVPINKWFPTTMGAMVEKYCSLKSAISLCQISLPSEAFMATR